MSGYNVWERIESKDPTTTGFIYKASILGKNVEIVYDVISKGWMAFVDGEYMKESLSSTKREVKQKVMAEAGWW